MQQVIRAREDAGYDAFKTVFTYQYHVAKGVDDSPDEGVCLECLPRDCGLYNGSDVPTFFPNVARDSGLSYVVVFKVNDHGCCRCDLILQNEAEACAQLLCKELSFVV
jgi:hypothetical protein